MSLRQKALLFLESAANITKGVIFDGELFTIDELKRGRLEICHDCDRFNEGKKVCRICGCKMEVKAGLAKTRCPLDKW